MKNLTGKRFGKLIAIKPTNERRNRYVIWLCKCDCGNLTLVRSNCLTSGSTKSCGCLLNWYKKDYKQLFKNKEYYGIIHNNNKIYKGKFKINYIYIEKRYYDCLGKNNTQIFIPFDWNKWKTKFQIFESLKEFNKNIRRKNNE